MANRNFALTGGLWVVDDATLGLEPWSPTFVPSPTRLPRMVVWMRLPDLLIVCWNLMSLEIIASTVGWLVHIDESTSLLFKFHFARVVEIDPTLPLVLGSDVALEAIDFLLFLQRFKYEHIHLDCNRCGQVGHRSVVCKFLANNTPLSSNSSTLIAPNSELQSNMQSYIDMTPVVAPSVSSAEVDDDRRLPGPRSTFIGKAIALTAGEEAAGEDGFFCPLSRT